MDTNIISIIIATKNGGQFLSRSISSIEKQTDKNVEVIIISDGSTDDTVSIAKKIAQDKPYIKIIELQKNIGPGLARNKAIESASGKYIAILDDDDEWLDENKLKNQKEFLDTNPDCVLVGADETYFVDENQNPLFVFRPKRRDKEIRAKILISNQFITSSVMFRKEAFKKAGGFTAMYLAEDYDLWLRMLQVGKAANISSCTTRYYKRTASAGNTNKQKMNRVVLELVKKYRNNFPHPILATFKAHLRIILG